MKGIKKKDKRFKDEKTNKNESCVMNRNKFLLIIMLFLFFPFNLSSGIHMEGYHYLSPKSGTKYAPASATILIRFTHIMPGDLINLNTFIEVKGDINGPYSGNTLISTDNKTIIFKPSTEFISGETVSVSLSPKLFTANNKTILPLNYQFTISKNAVNSLKHVTDRDENKSGIFKTAFSELSTVGQAMIMANGVSVPSDFPNIEVNQYGTTAEGKLFFASGLSNTSDYIIILNNDGTPYFYRRFGRQETGLADFRVQENGLLTYFTYMYHAHFVLNQHYEVVDTLRCAHGYPNNNHEVLLTKGHTILIANNTQIVDMSKVVDGGHPSAFVRGMDIQEFDDDKNLIFEWSTWDHLDINDALHMDLRQPNVDLVHMNSIAIDYDNHLIVSIPHYNQVIKINRETGAIIWRLGGVQSDFTFINDPEPFTYQHDARPVPGNPNHYTIFDNGTYRSSGYARGVEYLINTDEWTAEKVWEYNPDPKRITKWNGSLQVLPNGKRLFDWTYIPPIDATEVTYDGDLVYKLTVDEFATYRTRRYPWQGMGLKPYLIVDESGSDVTLVFNKFGDAHVAYYNIYTGTSPNPTALYDTSKATLKTMTDLETNQTYYFRVTAVSDQGEESDFSNEEMVTGTIPPGENIVQNGDFSEGIDPWICSVLYHASASWSIDNGTFHYNIMHSQGNYDDIQLIQNGIKLVQGKSYTFEFDGWADTFAAIEAKINQGNINYSKTGYSLLMETHQHFSYTFEMERSTDTHACIEFNFGNNNVNVYLDNVSLKEVVGNDADEKKSTMPFAYKLEENYPNPFNNRTIIQYQLPKPCKVELSIYNLIGQKLTTLVSVNQQAGKYQVNWDATDFPSGIYYYIIKADEFRQVKKMIMLK
jgi:hypothetical protein